MLALAEQEFQYNIKKTDFQDIYRNLIANPVILIYNLGKSLNRRKVLKMLDINLIRTNPELVKENIKKKFQDKKLALVDEVLLLDKKKRELQQEGDNLRAQRNSLAKQIGTLMREGKKEEAEKTKEISKKNNERVAAIEAETAEIDVKLKKDMMAIPNIIAADVPVGKDDSDRKSTRLNSSH